MPPTVNTNGLYEKVANLKLRIVNKISDTDFIILIKKVGIDDNISAMPSSIKFGSISVYDLKNDKGNIMGYRIKTPSYATSTHNFISICKPSSTFNGVKNNRGYFLKGVIIFVDDNDNITVLVDNPNTRITENL